MGMHRCDRCGGQGVIHGTSGANNVGQQVGEGLTKAVLALFLHPRFSFVGFWLISTGLLIWLANVLGEVLGMDKNEPHILLMILVYGIPVVLAVAFRKFVPIIMKWALILGGSALLIWMIVDLADFLKNR